MSNSTCWWSMLTDQCRFCRLLLVGRYILMQREVNFLLIFHSSFLNTAFDLIAESFSKAISQEPREINTSIKKNVFTCFYRLCSSGTQIPMLPWYDEKRMQGAPIKPTSPGLQEIVHLRLKACGMKAGWGIPVENRAYWFLKNLWQSQALLPVSCTEGSSFQFQIRWAPATLLPCGHCFKNVWEATAIEQLIVQFDARPVDFYLGRHGVCIRIDAYVCSLFYITI